jgi:hypothetical protein
MRSSWQNTLTPVLFVVVGAGAFAGLLASPELRVFWFLISAVVLITAGTWLSRAGRLSRTLAWSVGSVVRVEAWGQPVASAETFQIDQVAAFGLGLLIWLEPTGGGPRALLKIAQPGPAKVADERVDIGEAAWVSWRGAKLSRAEGAPAVVLHLA